MTSSTISPLAEYGLDNLKCDVCGDTGYVLRTDERGCTYSRECGCMEKRRSKRNVNASGLGDMVRRYTFESYETPSEAHRKIFDRARAFTLSDAEMFVISGQSGAGKTHICTAICNELLEKGRGVKYMLWRSKAAELKALVNEADEYKRQMNSLRNYSVLYIDDFLKGTVSDADINLAFTILNDRYNQRGKKTIISTERSMKEILSFDEATGSRIAERARGYILQAPSDNWRLHR